MKIAYIVKIVSIFHETKTKSKPKHTSKAISTENKNSLSKLFAKGHRVNKWTSEDRWIFIFI